jgi:hypothetical protein
MISCKEATFLITKQTEIKLNPWKKAKLTFHTTLCKYCKCFRDQLELVAEQGLQIEGGEFLSEDAKKRMEEIIAKY